MYSKSINEHQLETFLESFDSIQERYQISGKILELEEFHQKAVNTIEEGSVSIALKKQQEFR